MTTEPTSASNFQKGMVIMQLTEELREKDEELRQYRLNSQHTVRNPQKQQSSHEDMIK